MENIERYRHLNSYLKNKFGERTLKICIDGNFTCPNRDGKIGTSGCIFCSEIGSGEHILCNHIEDDVTSIQKQVKAYFSSYKATRANKFIAYFQNFTNTYDTLANLKAKYDAALIDEHIVGLEIATRPDCINEDIVKLIKSYSDKYYVCVELGLQTSNDETGKLVCRGYNSLDFSNADLLLNKYNIDVVAHIMVGLPGENDYLNLKLSFFELILPYAVYFPFKRGLFLQIPFLFSTNTLEFPILSTETSILPFLLVISSFTSLRAVESTSMFPFLLLILRC